jgi:hypothetical protein
MDSKDFGYVTVYYNDTNRITGKIDKPRINWSAIGSQSLPKTKQFIKQLQKALFFAENITPKKIKKKPK